MTKEVPTASSCVVKTQATHDASGRSFKFTLNIMNLAEHERLAKHFKHANIPINMNDYNEGGSRLGSTLVIDLKGQVAQETCDAFASIEFRRGVFVDGEKEARKSIYEVLKPAPGNA